MKLTAFPHAAESFKRGNMKICDNFGHFLKISAFKDVTSQNISVGYIFHQFVCLKHIATFLMIFLKFSYLYSFGMCVLLSLDEISKKMSQMLQKIRKFSKFSKNRFFWSKIRFCACFHFRPESSILNKK